MLARIFAQAILCRGREPPPAKPVLPALRLKKGVHPDLVMVQKPEGKANILVDQVRSPEGAGLHPSQRVGVPGCHHIEESESMNLSAANALLKVLEEPPGLRSFYF